MGDDTPTVSRRHALLRRQNGQYILEPLSPTNSTLLNGQRIFRPTVLRSGDEIRLSTDGPRLGVIFPSEPLRRFQSADAAPLPGNIDAKPPRQSRSALLWFMAILAAAAIGFGVWKIAELT